MKLSVNKIMYSAQITLNGSGHDLSNDSLACAKEYLAKVDITIAQCQINIFNLEDTLDKKEARATKAGRAFDRGQEKQKIISRGNKYFHTYEEAYKAAEAALERLF